MGAVEKAIGLAHQTARRLTGKTIIYKRDAKQVSLAATIGQTLFERADDYGAIVQYQSRDFLIPAATLILPGLGSAPVLPQAGDQIYETVGDRTFIHEVTAPGAEPAWRYADPFRNTLRVHTKQIEIVTES